jgi:hypothetical protein
MDKADESFSAKLEREICRWNGFAEALRKDDREAFDFMMGTFRSYSLEVYHASCPTIFEPMLICIVLAQKKHIRELDHKLQDLNLQRNGEANSGNAGEK